MKEKLLTAIILKLIDLLIKFGRDEFIEYQDDLDKKKTKESLIARVKNAKTKNERIAAARDLLNYK